MCLELNLSYGFEAEKIRSTSLQNLSLVLLHVSGTNREEESTECHGHITSLAVLRTHRKLGLATKLMNAARK
jgi:ribosomal protein S18 acetylase RimI-like enzyme